jgi:general secretion pathway protein G
MIRMTGRVQRGGFTLTELLIVLAILVALLALVLPRLLGSKKKADRNTAKAQIELFRGALERYALDNNGFPTTEQGLQALLAPPSDTEDLEETSTEGWDGPYVNKDAIEKDPWGQDYQYAYPPDRGRSDFPDIWSYGPDKEDNTEDDICSWSVGEGEEFGDDADLDIDVDVDVGGDLE